ncbi:hypothetical protein VO56_02205 [Mycoplasmopsis gallinacea]|uniref:Uncharacterized protein n=1 Tax=Mycoplasmopsis gallinacea TaxID=29556 RepID=A0A0D5ZJU7_9BACT|nr:hypothetical protein VO56_02205 [Mycoplasmopsis gallinacea]
MKKRFLIPLSVLGVASVVGVSVGSSVIAAFKTSKSKNANNNGEFEKFKQKLTDLETLSNQNKRDIQSNKNQNDFFTNEDNILELDRKLELLTNSKLDALRETVLSNIEREKQAFNSDLTLANEQIAQLKELINHNRETQLTSEEKLTSLGSKLETFETTFNEFKTRENNQENNAQINQSINELKQELKSLKEQFSRQNNTNSGSNNGVADSSSNSQELETKIDALKTRFEKLLENFKAIYSEGEAENVNKLNDLVEKLNSLEERVSQLSNSNNEDNSQPNNQPTTNQNNEELSTLKSELNAVKEQINQLSTQYTSLNEWKKQQEAKETSTSNSNVESSNNEQIKQDISSLKEQLETLKQRLSSIESNNNNQELETKIDALKTRFEKLLTYLNGVYDENSETMVLQKFINELNKNYVNEFNGSSSTNSTFPAVLKEKLSSIETKFNEKITSLDIDNKINTLKAEVADLRRQIQSSSSGSSAGNYDSQIAEIKRKITELEKEHIPTSIEEFTEGGIMERSSNTLFAWWHMSDGQYEFRRLPVISKVFEFTPIQLSEFGEFIEEDDRDLVITWAYALSNGEYKSKDVSNHILRNFFNGNEDNYEELRRKITIKNIWVQKSGISKEIIKLNLKRINFKSKNNEDYFLLFEDDEARLSLKVRWIISETGDFNNIFLPEEDSHSSNPTKFSKIFVEVGELPEDFNFKNIT